MSAISPETAAAASAAHAEPRHRLPDGSVGIEPGLLPETQPDLVERRSTTPIWRGLVTGTGLAGALLVATVVLLGVLGPLFTSYAPDQQIDGAYLLGPSTSHWFGTDDLNRDLLTRILYGIRVDLVIIFIAVPIGAVVGALVGLFSVAHPASDVVAQRAFDVILAFPALILGVALTAILSPGAATVGIIIAVAEVPIFGRLTRTSVLKVRELPFVEAARVSGATTGRILRRHVLPNSVEAVGVQLALSLSLAVFIEGALSYLGVGVRPPTPSLGSILSAGNGYLETNPWFSIGPLIVITALVFGFYLISLSISRLRRQ
ncbi:putative ABC transporter permease protein [Gordonia effusa NBRC 100432]|uniref:Putative ABC transporter permease protein n=1 Tax=Gordonia effusa NBRC 100432 TaxID=1077974 RepID=H0QV99_9ACTN|nr:ABC transporter permease [Gordonia effusa]GAB16750.1 putative ABC transporter permease protein [Gordonia effusa NBRC 100432]